MSKWDENKESDGVNDEAMHRLNEAREQLQKAAVKIKQCPPAKQQILDALVACNSAIMHIVGSK